MKTPPTLLAALLVVSSLSVVYGQTPTERPATPGSQMMAGDMQAAMQRMQEQMTKIRPTTDPAERQKLMLEHMSTMQESMERMKKTGGPGTGMMPGGGMMGGPSAAPSPSEVPTRMGTMEQRLGMMQIMMDQMMQHQNMMEHR